MEDIPDTKARPVLLSDELEPHDLLPPLRASLDISDSQIDVAEAVDRRKVHRGSVARPAPELPCCTRPRLAPAVLAARARHGHAPCVGKLMTIDHCGRSRTWFSHWALRGASAVALFVAIGCSGSRPTSPTLEQAAFAYATNVLHADAQSVNALRDPTCSRFTDDQLNQLRAVAHQAGIPREITVIGTQTRNVTADTAEAQALYDRPAGNDNWLTFKKEHGKWLVTDCTRLPYGGSGASASSSNAIPN